MPPTKKGNQSTVGWNPMISKEIYNTLKSIEIIQKSNLKIMR